MNKLSVVRNSDQHITDFDKTKITDSLFKEINYVAKTLNLPQQITKSESQHIANKVEKTINKLGFNFLSGPLIREITSMELLKFDDKRGDKDYKLRKFYTRVGLPVFDAIKINNAKSDETTDNANQANNPETTHKKWGDGVGKELTMFLLPHDIADAHMRGDIHIHDREYFTSRSFCIDASMSIPVKYNDNVSVMKLNNLIFDDTNYIIPKDLKVFTPFGCRKIIKITRRKIEKEKILNIESYSGKSLKVTKEHRIPIYVDEKMVIKRADELKKEDVLYSAFNNFEFNMHGKSIESINLIDELTNKVPSSLLKNVYVRKLKPIFNDIFLTSFKFIEILNILCDSKIEVNKAKQWFNKGIMPIILFKKLNDYYEINDYKGAIISTTGSKHEMPIIFPISSELMKILGYFVSDGNYNYNNLVITGDNVVKEIEKYTKKVFNSYSTITSGGYNNNIIGLKGKWHRAKQIYFGGKISKLIFKYVFEIPEGASNKRLPNIIYNLNDRLLHDFLSALFSGDGTVFYDSKKSSCLIAYSTVSETLKQELTMLLISLGMNPKIAKNIRTDNGYKDIYRIRLHGYKNIEKFKKYITFYNENQKHIDSFLSNVNKINRIVKSEKIKNISLIDSSNEYVYDVFLEIGKSETEHTFFVSDGLLIHNCMDHDLRFFFYYGFDSDCTGNTNIAGAAQHANVAILHCAKILGSAQTNYAGGQGFYNFLTFIAPYFEGMSYEEIEQLMQMFIFEMAQTMCARGGQVVFSSIQLSPGVPKLWKDKPAVYKGKIWNGENGTPLKTYGDFEKEVRLAFEALMKVMMKGDVWGKPFNFPKPEIAFSKEFLIPREEDEYFNSDVLTYDELYDLVFELAAKHGTPYFDNMVPNYRDTGGIECYQCCAFSFSATNESDDKYQEKIDFKNGEHFSMGGMQVISLNSTRASYKAKQNDFNSLMSETKKIIEQAISVHKIKKQWMRNQFNKGLVPFATQQLTHPVTKEKSPPLVDFDELVYIIGIVGFNETVWHHTGYQLSKKEGYEFAIKYMNHIKSYIHRRGKEENLKLVLARTPAETTAQRFAVSDLINYPQFAKKYVSGNLNTAINNLHESKNLPIYYSNGTHLPVDMEIPFFDRVDIEETFFPILDGGNIFHIWLNESNPSPQGVKEFVMNIIKNTLIGYFALTKNFTLCRSCFKQSGGIHEKCPHCESENVESFSRITGYIQSTAGWNNGKKEELKRRMKTNIR